MTRAIAEAMARSALERATLDPQALLKVAQLCRRTGAIEAARALAARYIVQDPSGPEASFARRLEAVLGGDERAEPAQLAHCGPAPFLRIRDFLPAQAHCDIRERVQAQMHDLEDSGINNATYHGVDASTRQSLVLRDIEPHRHEFMRYVKNCLRENQVADRVGLANVKLRRYELQATCHVDGAFFKPHADAVPGVNQERALSFVYYFHDEPRRFSGGDLLLYDWLEDEQGYSSYFWTRIEPEQNSIVFFPSTVVHEVTPVSMDQSDHRLGRLTLNGWFHVSNG